VAVEIDLVDVGPSPCRHAGTRRPDRGSGVERHTIWTVVVSICLPAFAWLCASRRVNGPGRRGVPNGRGSVWGRTLGLMNEEGCRAALAMT